MSRRMPDSTVQRLQQQASVRHKKAAQLKRKREKELNILTHKLRVEKAKAIKNAVFIPKDKKEFEEQFFRVHGMTPEEFNRGVTK